MIVPTSQAGGTVAGSDVGSKRSIATGLGYWVGRHPIWAILITVFLLGYVGVYSLNEQQVPSQQPGKTQLSRSTESNASVPGESKPVQQTGTTAVAPAPDKLTPKDFCEKRDEYAQEADRRMLDAGIESTTTATSYPFHESGGSCPKKNNTALVVTYAGADRVWAHTFENKVFLMELSVYGFKKLVLTNGFSGNLNETYTWSVPACPEDVCGGLSQ